MFIYPLWSQRVDPLVSPLDDIYTLDVVGGILYDGDETIMLTFNY